MKNRTANICKTSSLILGVIGLLVSSIIASEDAKSIQYENFSVGAFFATLICSFAVIFIICLFLYAVGEIISLLDDIKANTSKNTDTTKESLAANISNGKQDMNKR